MLYQPLLLGPLSSSDREIEDIAARISRLPVRQRNAFLSSIAAGVSNDPDRVLRRPEAARFIGMNERSLENLDKLGDGPVRVRLGKRAVGYRLSDVRAWLASRTK